MLVYILMYSMTSDGCIFVELSVGSQKHYPIYRFINYCCTKRRSWSTAFDAVL